jgi:hypothetical protein
VRAYGFRLDGLRLLRRGSGVVLHPLAPVRHVVGWSREGHAFAARGEPRTAHIAEGKVRRQGGILHLRVLLRRCRHRRFRCGTVSWEAESIIHAVGAGLVRHTR